MKDGKTIALIALISVVFIWGIDFIALDYMVAFISPPLITLIRISSAAIILLIIVLIKEKGLHIKKEDWPRVFICGAIGMSVYFTIESIGIEKTSGALASLILATVPVFGMFADRIIYKNKITPVKVVGIIGSIVGVLLLVAGTKGGDITGSITGILLMLVGAVLWTFYIVGTKPLYEKYDLLTVLTGFFLSGAVTTIPLTLLDRPLHCQLDMKLIIILIATTAICILVGEFLYVFSISKLSVTTVSLFENVLPLVTVLFSFLIFGELLSVMQMIGGGIVIVAVSAISLKE